MTNAQLYVAVGLPILFNTAMSVAVYVLLSQRITDLASALNQRFDDMRDLWRAELHRVEEVLDARLRQIEEPRH